MGLERALGRLPSYAALAVLILPSLLIVPLKILALWLIAKGQALLGVAVIVAGKLAGTALLAWLFQLIQPALLRLAWFARLYARWSGWKAELLRWVRGSRVWRAARALKLGLHRRLRRWRGRDDLA